MIHSMILNNVTNNCSNIMFKPGCVRKTEDPLADFCISHCPHENCKKGTCKEYKEFEKNYKKEVHE